jgi:hypothetical protein
MRKINYSSLQYKKCTPVFMCLLSILLFGCDRPLETQINSADFAYSITWQPDSPRAEQPIVFELLLPQQLQPQLSEVRGVSMYMGRIPLAWQQHSPGEWQATLLVGACSDPIMHWQLTIPLISASTNEASESRVAPIRVSFITSN